MPKQGYKPTEEHKRKIGLANLGHRHSDEVKKRMSLASKGKKGIWMQGRKHSEETKKKMSLARTKSPNRVLLNTSIELKIQQLLRECGIEFEINYPILGRPDIFIKPNVCIFADGCYWHKCSECGFQESIKKEKEKDKKITTELQGQGYIVIRLWEHDIKQLLVSN